MSDQQLTMLDLIKLDRIREISELLCTHEISEDQLKHLYSLLVGFLSKEELASLICDICRRRDEHDIDLRTAFHNEMVNVAVAVETEGKRKGGLVSKPWREHGGAVTRQIWEWQANPTRSKKGICEQIANEINEKYAPKGKKVIAASTIAGWIGTRIKPKSEALN